MDWIFTLSFSLVLWAILTLLLEHLHTTGSIIFFGMQRNSLLLVITLSSLLKISLPVRYSVLPWTELPPLWTQRLNYNSFLAGLPAACVESCVACSLTSLGNWKHFPFNIPTAVCPSLHCQHMHLLWLLLFSGQPFILRSTPRSARFLTWLLAGSFWGLKDSQQLLFLGMDLMQVWVSVLKQDGFQFL